MAVQTYTNLAQGTLSVAYTAGDTTLTLGTGQGALFPSTGNFVVALDSPPAFFLQATSRSADVITVNAAAIEGTTHVNEAIGKTVTQVITAGVLNSIRAEDRGGDAPNSWTSAPTVPLPTSGWTVFNGAIMNDFSVTETECFIPAAGSLSLRGMTRAITVPYTIIALIDCGVSGAGGGTQDSGLLISDGTKYETLDIEQSGTTQNGLRILAYTNTGSTSVVTGPTTGLIGNLLAFKIVNDSTHRTFYYGTGGAWTQFYQETSGTFLTETAAGIGGFSGSSTPNTLSMRLRFWSVT